MSGRTRVDSWSEWLLAGSHRMKRWSEWLLAGRHRMKRWLEWFLAGSHRKKLLEKQRGIDQLPEDVLTEILVKVPVESLVRLSCVCKAWRDLIIQNPYFGGKHLDNMNKNKKNGSTSIFFLRCTTDLFLFSEDKNRLLLSSRPNPSSVNYFRVAGSCNGIVCLVELKNFRELGDVVLLYNPVTREDVQLCCEDLVHELYSFGFGFDASNKDYKVVRIGSGKFNPKKHAEIYKLSTNCWSKLCVDLECGERINGNGVYVNGFFHWRTGQRILTFDFRTETFGTFELPDRARYECMGVLDDSLAICSSRTLLRRRDVIDVWVMREHGNEESWMKKLSILQWQLDLDSVLDFWPVHGTNQLVLVVFAYPGQLVALFVEQDDARMTRTVIIETDGLPRMLGVVFQPTLVSLARD